MTRPPASIAVHGTSALLLCVLASLSGAGRAGEAWLDLTRAVVVHPGNLSPQEIRAVRMLVEEVEKRTGIRWHTAPARGEGSGPVITVGTLATLTSAGRVREAAGLGVEGYTIQAGTERGDPFVSVLGKDARGVLFGVGRLLRSLRMTPGAVAVRDGWTVATTPRYPLRGHQLGYRPKTNSYDGWTVAMWEQYIRDLVVFGANAVELIPPRSDDAADSPHFPLPPLEMMKRMSGMLSDYGLDVWVWYPALDRDYSDPGTVEFALREWGEVFRALPRLDAVFVPGGDPGHTRPVHLMGLLEKQTEQLRRHHPRAQMWVSPQSFSREWLDEFLDILRDRQPAWLSGVVFGPQTRVSLPRLRDLVPRKYPVRHYPDITHSRQCQYPVPDWDVAYAITEAREGINPRPRGQARIFRLLQPHTSGFLAYSEGCNDDVNKAVWSALGWDPDQDVTEILREYSRYFVGEPFTEGFTQGLLALERNWEGPLLTNAGVTTTLRQFQDMERTASPRQLLNWRFQQALYRAYYDSFTRARLIRETAQEEQALDRLARARESGSLQAMSEAEAILDGADSAPVSQGWRARVFELAESLFQSIRMQLSVERYKAISVGRGANLDTIDMPLNSRGWLKRRFAELRDQSDEQARLKGLQEIVDWTNPGPGGFYDDLGNPARQLHLVSGPGFDADPAFLESALSGFSHVPYGPVSWWTYAESLNDAPLRMRYTDLDPGASYRIRVVYAVESPSPQIRLVADGSFEVHPFIRKENPIRPLEFDIPAGATSDGTLELSWVRTPGLGGNGRGCQVAEVWLIRK